MTIRIEPVQSWEAVPRELLITISCDNRGCSNWEQVKTLSYTKTRTVLTRKGWTERQSGFSCPTCQGHELFPVITS